MIKKETKVISTISQSELEEGPMEVPFPGVMNRPTPSFAGVEIGYVSAMIKIEKAWQTILQALHESYGLNIKDPNFNDTPTRIARMMILERCAGINSKEECIKILGKDFPPMNDSGETDQLIITTSPAIVYGICPHHFENVRYHVWTAYVPNEKFVGISKFTRMVDLYGRQPLLQETFTFDLADIIMDALNPKGAAVVVKGWHDCMIARGAKSNPDSAMITSAMRGIFQEPGQETFKEEFFRLCQQTGI